MGLRLIVVWIAPWAATLMWLVAERFRRAQWPGVKIHWAVKFVLLCIAMALLEESRHDLAYEPGPGLRRRHRRGPLHGVEELPQRSFCTNSVHHPYVLQFIVLGVSPGVPETSRARRGELLLYGLTAGSYGRACTSGPLRTWLAIACGRSFMA